MEIKSTAKFQIVEDSKHEPDLEAAQKFVGGMVEGITFPNGDYLIINEEGKLMNLPLNVEATKLWRSTFTKDKYAFGYDDFVVGPAILIKAKGAQALGGLTFLSLGPIVVPRILKFKNFLFINLDFVQKGSQYLTFIARFVH